MCQRSIGVLLRIETNIGLGACLTFALRRDQLRDSMSHMKRITPLIAMLVVLCAASFSQAQEFRRNAWGVTAAPMSCELTGDDLSNYEVGQTDASLGLGGFYQHLFSRRVSARFELSARQNHYGTYAQVAPLATAWCTALETTIETVVALSLDRHVDMAGHDARFSIGVGPVISAVVDQTVGFPSFATTPPSEGSYGKFGLMLDAGLALGLDPKFGVFARFRGQTDYSTFSESDSADIVRKLNSFGFHVGAEFGL